MNSLFISPAFPPNAYLFCTALRARGATVLGIGDDPAHSLHPELAAALHEYFFAAAMGDYEVLRQAVDGLVARHGPDPGLESACARCVCRYHGQHGIPFSPPRPGCAKESA